MPKPLETAKLTDVARIAGVGIATASRALNGQGLVSEETRNRILEVARTINYTPNRSAQTLKGGRSGMVGMVIPRMSDLFFASCVDAVQTVAVQNGSLLVVAATHDATDRTLDAVRHLLHHKVDGLVLALSGFLSPSLERALKTLPVPAVGIDAPLSRADLPSVLIDNAASAASATQHLINHGYRRIVSVQAAPELFTIKERRRGYEEAMKSAGLKPAQHVVVNRRDAEDLLRKYSASREKYAVVAGNEVAAKYLIAASSSLALAMPEAFGMVSFDDFDLADAIASPLTVVRQPVGQIGETAAHLLFQRLQMEGEGARLRPPLETVLTAELVIRRSCGCTAAESTGSP